MPFNGECEDGFPRFRTGGSTYIIISHHLKNTGYLINIAVGLRLTEMVITVISDIFRIPTGFRFEINGFHQHPSYQL